MSVLFSVAILLELIRLLGSVTFDRVYFWQSIEWAPC